MNIILTYYLAKPGKILRSVTSLLSIRIYHRFFPEERNKTTTTNLQLNVTVFVNNQNHS